MSLRSTHSLVPARSTACLAGSGLADFSFGLVQILQEDEFLRMSVEKAHGFYAATAVSAAAAVHYYVDSFIWKVSDRQTQQGL